MRPTPTKPIFSAIVFAIVPQDSPSLNYGPEGV
jgi:hypothetical protein